MRWSAPGRVRQGGSDARCRAGRGAWHRAATSVPRRGSRRGSSKKNRHGVRSQTVLGLQGGPRQAPRPSGKDCRDAKPSLGERVGPSGGPVRRRRRRRRRGGAWGREPAAWRPGGRPGAPRGPGVARAAAGAPAPRACRAAGPLRRSAPPPAQAASQDSQLLTLGSATLRRAGAALHSALTFVCTEFVCR
ncbi:unnamed protein product [Prorocentrum cordatum]|uniref:Uncharacterized protein n=1 Tax=Prorocentrum cordatum TaxID=2364126 RepID=A0ABN9PL48_9DINO|nr:unnamed protein product [Polarella glacialis]